MYVFYQFLLLYVTSLLSLQPALLGVMPLFHLGSDILTRLHHLSTDPLSTLLRLTHLIWLFCYTDHLPLPHTHFLGFNELQYHSNPHSTPPAAETLFFLIKTRKEPFRLNTILQSPWKYVWRGLEQKGTSNNSHTGWDLELCYSEYLREHSLIWYW